jgi:hypothetical protein
MTRREYCYRHYERQHYCFNCSHIDGLHPKVAVQQWLRQEWYVLGNVKLAEATVFERCKCDKYISKLDFVPPPILLKDGVAINMTCFRPV